MICRSGRKTTAFPPKADEIGQALGALVSRREPLHFEYSPGGHRYSNRYNRRALFTNLRVRVLVAADVGASGGSRILGVLDADSGFADCSRNLLAKENGRAGDAGGHDGQDQSILSG